VTYRCQPSTARTVVAAFVACLAAVAAGCSSTTPGNGSRTPTVTPAASSTTPTTSGTASPTDSTTSATTTSPAASSTPGGVSPCSANQLTVTGIDDPGGAAAGHRAIVLLFKNITATTCTLFGYPGADALNSAGTTMVHIPRTLRGYMGGLPQSQAGPATVTLAPGATVSAKVEGSDVPQGGVTNCPDYPALLVTPPNTTQSTHVDITIAGCNIQIHPVVPGSGG
jgi:hypothetical protein